MSNSTTKLDDRDIIRRFNEGDIAVFSTLVDRYSQRAYQIAYGILRNPEDAQEVAQDVFVRIYKALPSFRGDAEFTTWMYRIAANLAKNKYRWNRSRGIQREVSIDEPQETEEGGEVKFDVPEPRSRPDEETAVSELQERIAQEIEKLPPAYREALVLRNFKELSYEEIASVVGCKLGTIKSRIARAREELRRRLEL